MPPSAKKRLDWTAKALDEFDDAMRFYAERNPIAADRMADEIIHAALLLIDPLPTPGRPGRIPGTFERPIGRRTPFTLIYREKRTTVQIIRVLHHARKYP
jgi:plasmid stabilization system protein ParE